MLDVAEVLDMRFLVISDYVSLILAKRLSKTLWSSP